jgi:solute carrier family 35 protein E1
MPTNAETTSHGKLDKINLLYFSSGMAFTLMVPVWIYSDFWRLFYFTNTSETTSTRLVVYFILNGVVHFAQNLLAFAILSSTSPVTYSIASLVKRIAVICLAIVWFKQSVHAMQAFGIALTAVGLWMYNNAKRDVEKGEKKMRQVEAVREGGLPISVEKVPASPRPSYSDNHSSTVHRSGFEHVEPPPKGRRRMSDHLVEKPFHMAVPRNGPLPELVAQ